jgi:hypothetical protein
VVETSAAQWQLKDYKIAIMICELRIIMNVPDFVIQGESFQSEQAPKSSKPLQNQVLGISNPG